MKTFTNVIELEYMKKRKVRNDTKAYLKNWEKVVAVWLR